MTYWFQHIFLSTFFFCLMMVVVGCTSTLTPIPLPTSTVLPPLEPTATTLPTHEPTEEGNNTAVEVLKVLFAQKYNKPADQVILSISQQTNNHVRGTVQFSGEMSGAMFLAARENNIWKIVFDGNGVYTCQAVEPYNFPAAMVEDCYEEKSESTTDALKKLFAIKYNQPQATIQLSIAQETKNHVRGGIRFGSEVGGALFLAARVNGAWKIVFDGNGSYSCQSVQPYTFPAEMISDCAS